MALDLKFGPRERFHRLTTTGYALVLESLFERPVDVGCVVYARVVQGRVVVERDFHVIGDELSHPVHFHDLHIPAVSKIPWLCSSGFCGSWTGGCLFNRAGIGR